jgi:phosphate transport system permease protein
MMWGVGALAWSLGPVLERMVFVVTDPSTGALIGDFRLWWPHVTGTPFEQRNSLVVGFMMGFAVIPIIFTIAEDALTNVPVSLRSASLALGASRWQTAFRIVLPTASAGIFSALMIGLGRAVGETMIVVMAAGLAANLTFNPLEAVTTFTVQIKTILVGDQEFESAKTLAAFALGFVLFFFTLTLNVIAMQIVKRYREQYD